MKSLQLKRGRAGPAIGRHPWIFASMLESPKEAIENGEIVQIITDKSDFIGYGIFNARSEIRVRVYSWAADRLIDENFWHKQILAAYEFRKKLNPDFKSGRWIFSEADDLSGLVVDRYEDFLVCQINSFSIEKHQDLWLSALANIFSPKGILVRRDKKTILQEGLLGQEGVQVVRGDSPPNPLMIENGGLRFQVDLFQGQKSGFYFDQILNREILETFCYGKSVLDLFCFSGAFSLHAARGGAARVLGVDSSELAIQLANQNLKENGFSQAEFLESDVYDYLTNGDELFDIIIVDPPKMAPNRNAKHQGIGAYFRLNALALKRLKPGGILFSMTCSHQVKRSDLRSILSAVLRRSKKASRIIYEGGQSPDHPISLSCPETEYLKSIMVEVL